MRLMISTTSKTASLFEVYSPFGRLIGPTSKMVINKLYLFLPKCDIFLVDGSIQFYGSQETN